ncbi:MAG: RDD family protein [Pedobacter sp.]|nr:MAG: RDD family protein [Pedobacter sp.]
MEYYLVENGKVKGPLSLTELQSFTIKPDTFIKKVGMDDFKEAHEMEEFRALFGFTENFTAPQYFAAFDQRLLASAIDFFLITLVYVFLVLISYIFIQDAEHRILALWMCLPLIVFTKYIYGIWADCSKTQGTIGKKVLQIKVTQLNGKPISWNQSFLRNTAKIFSVLPLFLGYLMSFLNKKNQCLHDLMANTLVTKDRLI